MGQQGHADDCSPSEPHVPQPDGQKEEGEEEQLSASQAPEEQTVPELIDALAEKIDRIFDQLKQLLEELRAKE